MNDARPTFMTRPLADGVFMVPVDEDIIVLDTRSDTYGCLADLSGAVCISGDRVRAPAPLIEDLTAAGMLGTHPGPDRPAILPLPSSILARSPAAHHPTDPVCILRAVRRARQLGHGATVSTLVSALPTRPTRPPRVARVAAVTGLFQALLPWMPDQGVCLYRAFVLLSALRLAGEDAIWVFGVRTWPFSAHCWLQAGDSVLDDDPERVGLYTPIMAV